jgi:hypothetical protein
VSDAGSIVSTEPSLSWFADCLLATEGSEFCKLAKIARVGSYHYCSQAAGTYRHQRFVGPLQFLVVILCG